MGIKITNLIKIKELANMLGYSPNYVYNLVNRGEIPHLKLPTGAIRFDRDEIERWIADDRKASPANPKEAA